MKEFRGFTGKFVYKNLGLPSIPHKAVKLISFFIDFTRFCEQFAVNFTSIYVIPVNLKV